MDLLGHYNYYVVVVLMMIGFYAVIARGNMAKKIMGLNLFQTSAFILFISAGKISAARRRSCAKASRSIPTRCRTC